MKSKSCLLLALTSSAAMLPPYQVADASTSPEKSKFGYRYSNYQEDNTKNNKTFGGAASRYDIKIHQFQLLKPLSDEYVLTVDVQTESLSGASPWFTELNSSGEAQLVMSGASIDENRTDVIASLRRYTAFGELGVSVGNSNENDYKSNSFSFDGVYELDNKHTTLNAGLSFSNDKLSPTQGVIPAKVVSETKDTQSLFFGVGQVINKLMVAQFGLSYTQHSGYLTDPYKKNDLRPDKRSMLALSAGARYYFTQFDAALHADYRYYDDDWGVTSHTITASWHHPITDDLEVIPSIRYYSQQSADFFSNVADLTQTYYADDFRLSTYSAIDTGIKVKQSFGDWGWSFAINYYQSQTDSNSAPGLVNFFRYTIGVDYYWE